MTRVVLDAPHRLAGHCGSGSMRDLLEHAGLSYTDAPMSEALVFALSGGLAFQYARDAALTPPVYLVGRTGTLELDLARRLGAEVEMRRSDDPVEGWRFVTDEVDAGRPALINAELLELPYLRVQLSNTRHSLLVSGYDTDRGVAYLLDNDRAEVQEVPLDALDRARSADGFPDPPRYATFPIRWPDLLPDVGEAARGACASVVAQMTEGAGLFGADRLGSDAVSVTGLAGVETFAADVAAWPDLFDERLDAVRFALWVFIEKAGTGGAMFRRLHADGLREAAELAGDPALDAAAEAWTDAADGWSRVAAVCRDVAADLTAAVAALPGLEASAIAASGAAAQK